MKILLTGGTGYLGQYLVKNLAKECEKVYLLVRSRNFKRNQKKFQKFSNVECIVGDITSPDVIDDDDKLKLIYSSVTAIVHAAAFYDLEGSYSDCFLQNVVGTQNLLHMANQCPNLEFFHYVSTIAVSGDYQGELKEEELELGQNFKNHYARTKFDAELMVRKWKFKSSKKRIYRLGVLVGDSKTGKFSKVDGPYYFFEILSKLQSKRVLLNTMKYLPMPFEKTANFPLIPVDHAADFMTRAIFKPQKKNLSRTYHVLSHDCPQVGDFIQDSFDQFGFSVNVVPLPKNRMNNMIMEQIGLPKELLSYMYSGCVYDQKHMLQDFQNMEKSLYSKYKEKLFSYACKSF